MNRKISILTVLLVLQMGLLLVFSLQSQPAAQNLDKLWSFETSQVNGMTINDADTEVILQREGERWQVGGYPADQAKIDGMLDKLSNLGGQWPVATTAASADRFEVSEDNFQRRIVLDGVDLPALYLGTSPGFQKVHGRRADSDAIYSIGLSNFELPVSVDGWLDKKLLALAEAPTSVTLIPAGDDQDRQTLVKESEGWLYNGGAADQDVATTYANRFTTLQVVGVANDMPEDLVEQASIELQNDSEQKQVTISRAGESDNYYIAVQGEPAVFSLATYIAEQLLMTDVDFAAAETDEEAQSLQGEG
ncbi:MAG: DUF4340 domain-containing protein [bacterium]